MRQWRALVVDDSPGIRQLVTAALSQVPGGTFVEACDGAEGIRHLTLEAFDIVFTDLNMPVLNGLALVSFIRQQPSTRSLPVVVVTTESAAEDRKRLLAAGANAYVNKPFRADALQAQLRALLRLD
jgi:two-component system chemotaxis response regulator CheY